MIKGHFVACPSWSVNHLTLNISTNLINFTFTFFPLNFSKSWLERIAAEATPSVRNPSETSDSAKVLGWEILEAEGTVKEKQTESSLSTKEEDTSGLVKAIVGVFHKG